ncbi:MAG TPA: low specificity L-threonine aldolase, partial [Pirellulales bacterium]|nr:low specificity L-threonine aldolase [Pirellulales bacterium]
YRVDPRLGTAADFSARLKRRGVLISAFGGPMMRAVTHLDVSTADIDRAAEILRETAKESDRAAPGVAATYG